jgi:hypothetical protein
VLRCRREVDAGSPGTTDRDRPPDGPARLIAELDRDEGKAQALAVLHGEGAYLERARAGEPGLCRRLNDDPPGQRPLARAA